MEKVIIGNAELLTGDSLSVLKTLPEKSIQCCVTSPPYYGLRDYQIDGQIGLEETPDEYVNKLVDIFREVKRVLKDNGTLWMNLGDSYAGSGKGAMADGSVVGGGKQKTNKGTQIGTFKKSIIGDGLKPKDLMGIPWMVAVAVRADGWYLRQDIIWSKPNAFPESVKDRFTKAHEYIFLLSKSQKYYFDAQAVAEPTVTKDKTIRDRDSTRLNNTPGRSKMGGLKTNNYEMRNKRSVWTVNTKPFLGSHFAVFPPELITSCILAGSKPDDVILDPFNGAATTGIVALKHGRKYIGIDLNPEYIVLSEKRLKETDYTSENYKQLSPQKLRKGFFK